VVKKKTSTEGSIEKKQSGGGERSIERWVLVQGRMTTKVKNWMRTTSTAIC